MFLKVTDAQSRTLDVKSLEHLKSLITSADDDDDGDMGVTEKYTLLAFYDSSNSHCSDILQHEILYPWPFAGYSSKYLFQLVIYINN